MEETTVTKFAADLIISTMLDRIFIASWRQEVHWIFSAIIDSQVFNTY